MPVDFTSQWPAAVERVKAASPRHGASLSFGRLLYIRDGVIGLAYPRESAFHRGTVTATTGRQLVEKSLCEHFGRPMRLVLEDAPDVAARAGLSLAEQEQQSRDAYERSTEAKVRSHAAIRTVLRTLGGEIEHVQVLEKERPAPSEPDTNDDGA